MDKPQIDMSNPLMQILKGDEELKDGQWKELATYLSDNIGSDKLNEACSSVTEELGDEIGKTSRIDRRGRLLQKIGEIAELVNNK